MATGTVYLDVDDEITSAAARIRGSESTKIAMVVPYGSRIATSRMNFRLLSREAVVNNRRLSVVAADPATRALAASAGLPAFATVGEYEASLESAAAGAAGGAEAVGLAASETVVKPPPDADPVVPPAGVPPVATATPAATTTGRRKRATKAADPVSNETQAVAIPLPLETPPATPVRTVSPVERGPSWAGEQAARPTTPVVGPRIPVIRSRRMPRVGAPAAIVAAVAVLALVVGAVGAVVFLPSAEVTLTPRQEPIDEISLIIRADPDAISVDPDGLVVPAERLEVAVEVSETFTTAGRRVEETPAKGEITFSNLDFTSSNTIPGGSIVSTQSGIRFRTNSSVTVGRARLVGLQVVPTEAKVGVTAVKAGTAGNVEPNTILVIPAGEDPISLKVRNKSATTGGTREEFPRVSQADIDAALEALAPKLTDAFATAVDDGAGAPAGATVFPETAVLGDSAPTVDPATLLAKEQPTFELGLAATGTVIAVDDSPVEAIAESRLLSNVGPDHRLVDGSVVITPGTPTVSGGEVTFPVTAKAARVRLLDPGELLSAIRGQTVEQAEATLAAYGTAEITTWPEWVTSIPTNDSRVTLTIVGQGDAPDGSAAPSSSPAVGPTPS